MRVQRRADRRASVGRRTGQMTTHGRVTSDTRHPGDCAFSTCQPVRADFIGGSIELTGARLSLQLHRRADLKAGQITLFSRRVGTPDAHAVKVGDGPRAGSAVRRVLPRRPCGILDAMESRTHTGTAAEGTAAEARVHLALGVLT
jgi:hypothetical protein